MGSERSTKVQMGVETAKGTAVPATALWWGDFGWSDDSTHINRPENIGILPEVDSDYIASQDATLDLTDRAATYEQIAYLNEMSMPTATPAANGGTSTAYKYIYTPSVTVDLTTNKAYTWEIGDSTQAYEMEYGICKSFKLSGKAKEAVKMSASLFGRQWTKTTFTGAISPPTEEPLKFELGKIYLDPTTIGSTQLTGWTAFDLTYESGLTPDHTGAGALYFSGQLPSAPKCSGSFQFYHDAIGVARYDEYVGLLGRKMRMEFPGSALPGSGGTFATKLYRVDAFIKITSTKLMDKTAGQNLVKVNWSARKNSAVALWTEFTCVNLLATLP